MTEIKPYLISLLNSEGETITPNKEILVEQFVCDPQMVAHIECMIEKQNYIMNQWQFSSRLNEVNSQAIVLPNAIVNEPYSYILDTKQLNLSDINLIDIVGLEPIGLVFDRDKSLIEGLPAIHGTFEVKLLFSLKIGQENSDVNEKKLSFLVIPDPKTLWKNLPSDKEAVFWKEDECSVFEKLGTKAIIASSKRGRSHQNEGTFRDDDFAFTHIEKTGWSVVAVSDGAGSSSLSRKGSQLACQSVIEYFTEKDDLDKLNQIESLFADYARVSTNEETMRDLEVLTKNYLYQSVRFVHDQLRSLASNTINTNPELFTNVKSKNPIEVFHATLIFCLFKKYDFGYVFLTFGVGDCPIAVMNKEQTETFLLNTLDVGEYGGGTRFITQIDIFHSKQHQMSERFNLKILPDFSFLFLMTDGIYDPKFSVEANLEKHEKWMEFLNDLKGDNDDKIKVDFDYSNTHASEQLNTWMDFWSKGNHDDRTLAVVF